MTKSKGVPTVQLGAVAAASVLMTAIFAQGALTRGTSTVTTLQGTFPTMPAIVICILAVALAIGVSRRLCRLGTATWCLIGAAILLCAFSDVHTQGWLIDWEHLGRTASPPWWSNSRIVTYDVH